MTSEGQTEAKPPGEVTTPVSDQAPASAPSVENGSAVRCHRCGVEAPAANACPNCGAFLPGNEAALKSGLRRYQTTGVLPADLRVSVEEFREGVISDQGGLENLSAARAGLVRVLVDCEVGRRLTMNEAIRAGLSTKAGGAAYDRLLATIDRWLRTAQVLGLERKARRISNVLDALEQEPEA